MDAPTAFFFNLEKNEVRESIMACLRFLDGRMTTGLAEMRQHAVDYSSSLFGAEGCDQDCAEESECIQVQRGIRQAVLSLVSYTAWLLNLCLIT